jgi:hypothetical protein
VAENTPSTGIVSADKPIDKPEDKTKMDYDKLFGNGIV